jgi:hypothetical protein
LSQNVFGCYKTYFQDLPVYTKKIITVVDYLGELDFGAAVEDTSAWMIKNDQFLKYLKNLQKHHKRFWLFIKNESIRDFKHNFPEIPLEIKRCENGLCVGTCLEASAPAIPGES